MCRSSLWSIVEELTVEIHLLKRLDRNGISSTQHLILKLGRLGPESVIDDIELLLHALTALSCEINYLKSLRLSTFAVRVKEFHHS